MTEQAKNFWAGVRSEIPLLIGVIPFGLIYGALAVNAGGAVTANQDQTLVVSGLTVEQVGELAATNHIVLYSLAEGRAGLEEMFLDLSGAERSGVAPDGSSRGGA